MRVHCQLLQSSSCRGALGEIDRNVVWGQRLLGDNLPEATLQTPTKDGPQKVTTQDLIWGYVAAIALAILIVLSIAAVFAMKRMARAREVRA